MMKKKYVYEQLVSHISSILKTEGFKFIKSKERIIRNHSLGFDVIIFHIVDYSPVFEIDFFLRTRIDEVENIVNRFMLDCMNTDFMSLTETTAISYKQLAETGEDCIKISNEQELTISLEEIALIIKSKGIDFFELNRNVQKVNEEKKRHILSEHQSINLYHNRRSIMQSLTLMRLSKDPDFDRLCDKYVELYVPFVGEEENGRRALAELIQYLKKQI